MNQTLEPIIKEPITDETRFTITPEGRAALRAAPMISKAEQLELDTDEYAEQCLRQDCPDIHQLICRQLKKGMTPAQIERDGVEVYPDPKFAHVMMRAARHLIRMSEAGQ